MLGGGNSGGGIANDTNQSSNNDEMSQISNDMDDEITFNFIKFRDLRG